MIELLNMDCMDFMKTCKDNEFDVCITSPPYNMNLRTNKSLDGYMPRTEKDCITKKYKNYNDSLSMDEYMKFLVNFIREANRVSDLLFFNIQMVTGNKPALFKALGEHADKIKELIIWDKINGQPAIGERTLNSRFEMILVFSDNAITRQFNDANFERGTLDNLWQIKRERSSDSSHGATFPMFLIEKILSSFSGRSQRIFDPFLGTGTTAIASHYFGCDFVGCEIDKDYYDAACKRFKAETAQETLF